MLNKDELLRRTNNGLDVFKHYISTQWKTGRNFLNPLYYISPQINRAVKNKSYFYNCYGKEEKFYIENQG